MAQETQARHSGQPPFDEQVSMVCSFVYKPNAPVDTLIEMSATAALCHGLLLGSEGERRVQHLLEPSGSANESFPALVAMTSKFIETMFLAPDVQRAIWQKDLGPQGPIHYTSILLISHFEQVAPRDKWANDRLRLFHAVVFRSLLFGVVMWRDQPSHARRLETAAQS